MRLRPTQVQILKVLATRPKGLCKKVIERKIRCSVSAESLGPLYREDRMRYPQSLYALGMVAVAQYADEKPIWTITRKGLEAAEKHSALERTAPKDLVPREVLDPAVIAVRDLKSYGLERWLESDVSEVRALLPEEYRKVNLVSLRHQIVNRRKQGAYARKPQPFKGWYLAYRESQHWKRIETKALQLLGGCSMNPEHVEGVIVHHRAFFDRDGVSVLNRESHEDVLALCPQCFRRNWKYLPEVPEDQPEE